MVNLLFVDVFVDVSMVFLLLCMVMLMCER